MDLYGSYGLSAIITSLLCVCVCSVCAGPELDFVRAPCGLGSVAFDSRITSAGLLAFTFPRRRDARYSEPWLSKLYTRPLAVHRIARREILSACTRAACPEPERVSPRASCKLQPITPKHNSVKTLKTMFLILSAQRSVQGSSHKAPCWGDYNKAKRA